MLAGRMNDRFGPGTASYVGVRDEFTAEEHLAWVAFFEALDAREADRKAQKEHDAMMKAAEDAARRG